MPPQEHICLVCEPVVGGGGSLCPSKPHASLTRGVLRFCQSEASGAPEWQEEKRPAFLCLPAVSVILPQPGPATGIGSRLSRISLITALKDALGSLPVPSPWAVHLHPISMGSSDLVNHHHPLAVLSPYRSEPSSSGPLFQVLRLQ